jgi:hypothetical protein
MGGIGGTGGFVVGGSRFVPWVEAQIRNGKSVAY